MANKEGKFFEQLGMLAENAYEAGEVFQRITEGKMETEDGVDAVHATVSYTHLTLPTICSV